MIEVKMARALTREGVEGVRWVLMDPLEARPADVPAADAPAAGAAGDAPPASQTAAPATSPASSPASSPARPWAGAMPPAPAATRDVPSGREAPRQALMLGALKTLVVLVALGAAIATAWRVIGPPRWPGQGAASDVRPVGPAVPAPPASAPLVTAWDSTGKAAR
ncbi:hypothetical protein AACH10_11405 [Ideonella sp. DXS22W]|uniref:Uncharacterized protein n=1 Tax=Pseudaquabacterium inlustre TaxID=2984192 RepID=A0ABU9CG47_9BURK